MSPRTARIVVVASVAAVVTGLIALAGPIIVPIFVQHCLPGCGAFGDGGERSAVLALGGEASHLPDDLPTAVVRLATDPTSLSTVPPPAATASSLRLNVLVADRTYGYDDVAWMTSLYAVGGRRDALHADLMFQGSAGGSGNLFGGTWVQRYGCARLTGAATQPIGAWRLEDIPCPAWLVTLAGSHGASDPPVSVVDAVAAARQSEATRAG